MVTAVAPVFVGGCGDPADRVRVGMKEADVVQLLGPPSRTVMDPKDRAFYVGDNEACATKAARVWLYKRTIGEDVIVVLDAAKEVACVGGRKSSFPQVRRYEGVLCPVICMATRSGIPAARHAAFQALPNETIGRLKTPGGNCFQRQSSYLTLGCGTIDSGGRLGRNKGICTLCGKGGPLTFEHVPPEASGNLRVSAHLKPRKSELTSTSPSV